MSKRKPYCVPLNAGLASETGAVCRRIGRLINALDSELTSWVVDGQIDDHIRAFRLAMMKRLKAEGWSLSYSGGNRMRVRPPGHRKPYN